MNMQLKWYPREKQLMRLMRDYGYAVSIRDTHIKLIQKAIPGYTSDHELPWAFASIIAAAEHLIPIVRDENYRKQVTP
jgi:hypothetical protein